MLADREESSLVRNPAGCSRSGRAMLLAGTQAPWSPSSEFQCRAVYQAGERDMNRIGKLVLLGLLLWPWMESLRLSGESVLAAEEAKIPRKQMTDEKPVHSVAFSPDGKTLAAGGAYKSGGEIKLWEVSPEK
jgi:WD40 repeat protein